jgi:site-specific recombinase XerD
VAWLRAGGVARSTLELRRAQIGRLITDHADRSPWELTSQDLASWLTARPWSNETIRSHRSLVRSFFGWAHAAGLAEIDPSRLLRKVPASKRAPRPATETAVAAALLAADARVYLMIMLGARHGLRRGEIAVIHSADLIRTAGAWSLLVHGKGGKDREVPLLSDVAQALRERPAGWAFPNGQGWHLTAAYTGKLISRTLPAGVTPHQLRHRFATEVYQRTGRLRSVQELLGHASVATTQIYTKVGSNDLRDAVEAASRIG